MFVLNLTHMIPKHVWLARTGPYEYTHMVRQYSYGWSILILTKYSYSLENLEICHFAL